MCGPVGHPELLGEVLFSEELAVLTAPGAPDLDQPCFRRVNGETMTGRQRLELLAKHWAEHVQELKAAEATR